MEEALFAGCWERPISFIADGPFRLVDSYYGDANRVTAATLELNDLIAKVIYYAVYLLNHRLRENLHFDADFDRSYWTSGHQVAGISNCGFTGNNLSEGPVTAPGRHAASLVLDVQYAILAIDGGFN